MTEPPTLLHRAILNGAIKRNLEINGRGPPIGSDTQRENETKISHMERSASLHMRETLRPVPVPRSKTLIEPVSREPGRFQRCQDQQKATQGVKMLEEDEEKEPCSPLLPSQSSPQPPSPHSSASALPLPPPPPPPPPPPLPPPTSVSEEGQIPLYLEILPEATRLTEVSNLERSTSLLMLTRKQLTPVHRSKSDSEPVFRKLASFFTSRDQQKANRGAKKPLDNCNRNPRPERPPPPNFSKSRGGHKALLPVQMSTGAPLNGRDTQDGDNKSPPGGRDTQDGGSESRLKMLEEDEEKEPCSPLIPSQSSPQPPSPHSSASALPLPPPPPPPCSVSEEGQIPLYLEILAEETRPPEVNHLERSTSLLTLKSEPPTPVHRSKSHSELLFRKLALLQISQDQQKADQGAKKPLDNCHRNPRPERPPPPNFSKSRGGHKALLPVQMSTGAPLNGRDTQDGDNKSPPGGRDTQDGGSLKMFEKDENEEKEPCSPLLPSQSSPQPPSPHSSASALPLPPPPPPPPPCSVSEQGQIPLYLEILPEETRPTEVSPLERSTSLLTLKSEPPTPVHRSKSHSELLFRKPAWLRIGRDQQKANQGAKKPLDNCHRSSRPERPPPPNFSKSRGGHKPLLPVQMSTWGPSNSCDTQYKDTKTPPVGFDTEYEDSKTPPAGFDTACEDRIDPPGSSDTQYDDKTYPVVCDTQYKDSKTPPVASDTQYEDRKTPPFASDTQYGDSETSLGACDTQYTDIITPPGASNTGYEDRKTSSPGASNTGYEDRKTSSPGASNTGYEDRKTSSPGASNTGYEDRKTSSPGASNTGYEDRKTSSPGASNTGYEDRKTSSPGASNTGYEDRKTSSPGASDTHYEDIETSLGACDTQYKGSLKAIRSKAVHDFFSKRPLPPIPQSKSQSEPLYEELGWCSCVKNEDSEEHKPEDIEVLMAWWRTVEECDNMPLDYELKEEEEIRVFTLTAYRIKMGLRLFNCLLSKNSESLQNRITELNTTADNLDKARKRAKIATMTGGTTGTVGGVAVVAGLVLAPLTLGASLVVSAVGVGVATAGGLTGASAALTNKVNSNLDRKRVEKILLDYWDEVLDIERCLHFVCLGMGWLGQQDASRLRVADEETVAVARLAEVARGNSSSIQTACQSLEILQKFSLDMDDFFTNGESQKVKKGTETKFADKIRSLAQQLQDGLDSLMTIRENLTLAASTTGVYEEPRNC